MNNPGSRARERAHSFMSKKGSKIHGPESPDFPREDHGCGNHGLGKELSALPQRMIDAKFPAESTDPVEDR